MDTDHFEPDARLIPALHDPGGDSSARAAHRALRAEAQRQLRWLQRACARTFTTHTAGASGLIGPTARAGGTNDADVPRQANEDVLSLFD